MNAEKLFEKQHFDYNMIKLAGFQFPNILYSLIVLSLTLTV